MSETAKYQPSEAAYEKLRLALGYMHPTPEQKRYLNGRLKKAAGDIQGRGVILTAGSELDDDFVADWAEWHYRKRDTGAALSPALKDELLTRLVRQSTKKGAAT